MGIEINATDIIVHRATQIQCKCLARRMTYESKNRTPLTAIKYAATSRNPEDPKALQVKVPSKNAAPIPEAESPATRMGDPRRKITRLLAMADSHVGGDVRNRSTRELCRPARSERERELGGSIILENLGFGSGARVLGKGIEQREVGEEEGRKRGRSEGGSLGRGARRAKAICEIAEASEKAEELGELVT